MASSKYADLRYKFTSLLGAKAEHAGRLAVIYPLMRLRTGARRADLIQAGVKTIGLWRHRLSEWGDGGWKFTTDPQAVTRMRNCPPAFYCTTVAEADKERNDKTMPCRRFSMCPWCFGRRTAELYHTVAGNVMNTGEQLLVAIGRRKVDSERSLVQALDDHQDLLSRLFQGNMTSLSRVGGYYTVTAEPGDGEWLLSSRLLTLFPLDETFKLIPKGWKVKRWARPTPDDIAVAVAKVCRYPAGLLLGDVARSAEVIKARESLKLSNYLGVFRGEKADKRADASSRKARKLAAAQAKAAKIQIPDAPAPKSAPAKKPRFDSPSWFTGDV